MPADQPLYQVMSVKQEGLLRDDLICAAMLLMPYGHDGYCKHTTPCEGMPDIVTAVSEVPRCTTVCTTVTSVCQTRRVASARSGVHTQEGHGGYTQYRIACQLMPTLPVALTSLNLRCNSRRHV